MLKVIAFLALVSSGCMATSTGFIAYDWCQTRTAARERTDKGWENGPMTSRLIGGNPSPSAVDAYMMSAIAAIALVDYVLPKWPRVILHGVVGVAQTVTIHGNMKTVGRCSSSRAF